ncbi:hypothetical protein N7494_013228 [Penicillium frequentans]|uniref:Ankyrin n=1 Tax=Penicillium frequentans TaxID=3151616 RepID=A0AAD6CI34_9EURO|nr:hypothetical protein N7494_013228 [Penicillium glabrum]
MTALLVKSGIVVDSLDDDGRKSLWAAIHYSSSRRAVELLLHKGANPNFKNRSAVPALLCAVYPVRANPSSSNMLLTYGAKIDCCSPLNMTPFLFAISLNFMKEARALLEARANVRSQNYRTGSALHVAVASRYSSLDMITWLVDSDIDINQMGGGADAIVRYRKSASYQNTGQITEIGDRLLSLGVAWLNCGRVHYSCLY